MVILKALKDKRNELQQQLDTVNAAINTQIVRECKA